jgi:hypothetical protein
MVAALNRALTEAAGKPTRHRIRQEAKAPVAGVGAGTDRPGGAPTAPPPSTGRSQAALLRETLDHPLVVQARSLFDAAIRKVEPGRPRVAPVAPAVAAAPVADDDQRDHAGGDGELV